MPSGLVENRPGACLHIATTTGEARQGADRALKAAGESSPLDTLYRRAMLQLRADLTIQIAGALKMQLKRRRTSAQPSCGGFFIGLARPQTGPRDLRGSLRRVTKC